MPPAAPPSRIGVVDRRLLHLRVQIDHRERAVFHRIAGPEFDTFLQSAREHRPVEGAVPHRFGAALAKGMRVHVGFFVRREIDRLLLGEAVLGGQRRVPFTRPLRQRFLEDVQSP